MLIRLIVQSAYQVSELRFYKGICIHATGALKDYRGDRMKDIMTYIGKRGWIVRSVLNLDEAPVDQPGNELPTT